MIMTHQVGKSPPRRSFLLLEQERSALPSLGPRRPDWLTGPSMYEDGNAVKPGRRVRHAAGFQGPDVLAQNLTLFPALASLLWLE